MNFQAIDRRIQRLERQGQREAGFELPGRWYELRVAPSCPPDKRLHIRGGIVTPSGYWGYVIQNDFVLDWICDFENDGETQMDLIFSNANYYLPIILCYYWEWVAYYHYYLAEQYAEPVFDNVIGIEVETSSEAEAQIDAWMNGYTQWYQETMPLWGVVLKNDGATGVQYAIEPIDAVNRGRSYLYRDVRARHNISG